MAKSNVGKKPISKEEYTTNKVLTVFSVCLLGVLVLMVVQRLLDYTNTWSTGMLMVRVLLGIGIAGIIWGVVLLARELMGKRDGSYRIICGRNVLIASIVMAASMAVIGYLGTGPIKGLYVILPALAVYYLIYHSYAPEFFLIAADAGMALGLMWLVHRALISARFGWVAYAALAAAAVLTVVQLVCVWKLRQAGQVYLARQEGRHAFQPQCVHHADGHPDRDDRTGGGGAVPAGAYADRNGHRSGISVHHGGILYC